MHISHMTYTGVVAGAEPRQPTLQRVDAVEDFLSDHVEKFLASTKAPEATPPGRIKTSEASRLFRHLHTGTDEEFLAAAHELARRLIERMNKVTREGLLVALRAETKTDGRVAGLLKLEVVSPNGAVLQRDTAGQMILEAVQDMLDRPGKLQKGALATSTLPDDEIYCGDQLHRHARYFPEAFDVQVYARPVVAVKAFFDVVFETTPELFTDIAIAFHSVSSGPVRTVLADLADKVPTLSSAHQALIAEQLAAQARPVASLDTGRAVKETYKIEDVTVTGPVPEMRRLVDVCERPEGGWRLTIDSADEPIPIRQ